MHPNEIAKRDVSNSGVDFAQNIKHIAIKDKGDLHFSHLFGGDFLFLLYFIYFLHQKMVRQQVDIQSSIHQSLDPKLESKNVNVHLHHNTKSIYIPYNYYCIYTITRSLLSFLGTFDCRNEQRMPPMATRKRN